jgi:ATP:ADP antiporter, AAA family
LNAQKTLPLALLFFCISLVYHVLRCLKVTLVVKAAPGSGAEILPFLKIWVILPASFFITWLYTKHAINKSANSAIRFTLYSFMIFFILFITVLYPYRDAFFIDSLLPLAQDSAFAGIKGLINIFIYWPYTFFYICAEMWSTLVISILFWGFTNEISKTSEAKNYYALIGIGANVAGIFSGQIIANLSLSEKISFLNYGTTAWDQSVFLILLSSIFISYAILHIFNYLSKFQSSTEQKLKIKENKKTEGVSIFSSWLNMPKYANMIALIVICYNIIYNLADVIWAHQCSSRFTDPAMLNRYLGNLDTYTGIAALLISVFVFSPFIRRFGWKKTSIIPPVIWALTTLGLFAALNIESSGLKNSDFFHIILNMPILDLIMAAGTMQIFLGRAAKYTIFDQTKEMAYIPLPTEAKRKYKAVIDGLVSRLGKSISSLLIQGLLIYSAGNLDIATPYAFTIIAITLCIWLISVLKLGTLYEDISSGKAVINNSVVNDNSQISIIAPEAKLI